MRAPILCSGTAKPYSGCSAKSTPPPTTPPDQPNPRDPTAGTTHQTDRSKEDEVRHRRHGPVQPPEEEKRGADREHRREPVRVPVPGASRDVPDAGGDDTAHERADDARDEAEGRVPAEARERELAHETGRGARRSVLGALIHIGVTHIPHTKRCAGHTSEHTGRLAQ